MGSQRGDLVAPDDGFLGMDHFFFNGWTPVLRTVVVGVMAYGVLLVMLRISGKRTLSKMNAFDLVVTVAMGSTLATILLSKEVALAQGACAFAVLVGLQFAITWTSVRWPWVKRAATGEPTLLAYGGQLLPEALHQQRVTTEEVRAAVRSAGLAAMEDAHAVVLETDGSFSVVHPAKGAANAPSLKDVKGPPDRPASIDTGAPTGPRSDAT